MKDVGSVMDSLHLEKLSLMSAGESLPLPDWAGWLIWAGAWMRSQATQEGRRVLVTVLPTRRLAAAFAGLGVALAASRLHDASLGWEELRALPSGSLVHWRDKRGSRYAGTLVGVREVLGIETMAIDVQSPKRSRGTTVMLPRATTLSYGVTSGAVTNSVGVALSRAAAFLKAMLDDASAAWVNSPMADSALVTERTSFKADLDGLMLEVPGAPATALLDVLVVSDTEGRRHGKLRLVSTRNQGIEDFLRGVTILDGATAASRLGEASARSVIVLLDRADYDEEVLNGLNRFLAHSIDHGIHLGSSQNAVAAPPCSVDANFFALPEEFEFDHTA